MSFHRYLAALFGRARPWLALGAIVMLCALSSLDARAASVQPLEIVTKSGVQVFSVEMATTDKEKETGRDWDEIEHAQQHVDHDGGLDDHANEYGPPAEEPASLSRCKPQRRHPEE